MMLLAAPLAVCALVIGVIALRRVPIDRLAYISVGAFVLSVTWNGFRVAGGGAANVFLILAFGVVLLHVIQNRHAIPLPPWLLAAAAGFIIATMLAAIFPPERGLLDQSLISFRTDYNGAHLPFIVPRSDIYTLIKFEIAFLLVPLLIIAVATTKQRIVRLMDLFALSAAINAAVGLISWVGVPIAPYPTIGGRASGLTIHPNYLALTCTVAIPLALLWVTRGGRWRTAGLTSVALMLAGAYVSGSRAGAVTAVLAVIITVAAVPRLRKGLGYVLPIAGVLLVVAMAFTPVGTKVLDQVRLGGGSDTTGSDSARADLGHLAVRQFKAEPLHGVGMGVIQDAHDIYLQVLAAAGLIGAASFLIFLGGLASGVRRALGGPLRDPAVAAGVSVAMWLVNGRYDSQLADKYLYVVPGLLIAISCVAVARAPVAERPAPRPVTEPLRADRTLVGAS